MTAPTPDAPPVRFDLRSDTVTRPTAAMRRAMIEAEVGDDVYGEDPTVARLEAAVAARLGKARGLLMPSGTQSNLAALLAHCQRGDEYIVGQMAHCYRWEAGGAAVVGGIQPQPLAHAPDGTLPLDAIRDAIKPDDAHYAITRLLALENTHGGRVIPLAYTDAACALARRHGLACHLDGARVFNAAVALGEPVARVVEPFDTVSVCFSKGLGAPVGSVLVGSEALIQRAHRARKLLGGGMRQAGILAAAALHALEHHVTRLADDHANARRLAQGLAASPVLTVQAPPETNMVYTHIDPDMLGPFLAHMRAGGVAVSPTYGARLRWVTHLDLDADAVEAVIDRVMAFEP